MNKHVITSLYPQLMRYGGGVLESLDGQLVRWFVEQLVGRLVGRLVDRLVG